MTSSADGAAANAELTARAAEQANKMSLLMPISGPADGTHCYWVVQPYVKGISRRV